MKKFNLIIPPGSPLYQPKRNSSLLIMVLVILAIHGVFFAGLLIQGCKREEARSKTEPAELSNAPLALDTSATRPTMAGPDTNQPFIPAPSATQTLLHTNSMPLVTPPETKEYTVVKGDSFYKIAKANGLSIDAIARANPQVNPTQLQVGQKLQIPVVPPPPAPSMADAATARTGLASNGVMYVVKRGDTLTKIARNHGTSVKAIRSANGLKTDHLLPGKKLKMPEAPAQTKPAETRPAKLS